MAVEVANAGQERNIRHMCKMAGVHCVPPDPDDVGKYPLYYIASKVKCDHRIIVVGAPDKREDVEAVGRWIIPFKIAKKLALDNKNLLKPMKAIHELNK